MIEKTRSIVNKPLCLALAMFVLLLFAPCRALAEQQEGIYLDLLSLVMCPGDTAKLSVSVVPEGTDYGVKWSTDNAVVAAVEDGAVTAKARGSAVITASSADGKYSAFCSVTVISPDIDSTACDIDRVNGFIWVQQFTSAQQLLENISDESYITLLDQSGAPYSGIAAGTGMKVKLTVAGIVRSTLTVTVRGDVNGDGVISIMDGALARLSIMGFVPLSGAYRAACDADADGEITIADYTLIWLHITGTKPMSEVPELPEISDRRIRKLTDTALAQRGKPYVWGDEGETGFDCSGLIYYCLNEAGETVERYTADTYSKMEQWEYVDKDELEPGDLMFFRSDTEEGVMGHTGIYLGNGYFIHASSSYGCVIICPVVGWYSEMLDHGRRAIS